MVINLVKQQPLPIVELTEALCNPRLRRDMSLNLTSQNEVGLNSDLLFIEGLRTLMGCKVSSCSWA